MRFLDSLLKQCILFEKFLQFSLPPPYRKLKLEKILDTRVQHCLWGVGRGWTCVNWKTPQKCRSVPRLCISNLTISSDLHGILFLKNLYTQKTTGHVVKNTLCEHHKTLQLCYTLKYLEILYVKGQGNLQNTTVTY